MDSQSNLQQLKGSGQSGPAGKGFFRIVLWGSRSQNNPCQYLFAGQLALNELQQPFWEVGEGLFEQRGHHLLFSAQSLAVLVGHFCITVQVLHYVMMPCIRFSGGADLQTAGSKVRRFARS